MRIKVKGTNSIIAKLQSIGADTSEVRKEVLAGAYAIHKDAVESIAHGLKTGREYGDHIASTPGEAPATDEGGLISSIRVKPSADGMSATVGTDSPVGLWTEWGTRNMEPRPWLYPATFKNKDRINSRIKAAIKRTVQKYWGKN